MDLRAERRVASLPRRLFGFVFDRLALLPVYFLYGALLDAVLGPLVGVSPNGDALVVVAVNPGRVALELTLTLLTDAAYFVGSWWRWGTTPGQRLCGVSVSVMRPERPVDAARAIPAPGPGRGIPVPAAAIRWAMLQVPALCLSTLGGAGAIPLLVVASLNAAWMGLLFASTAADPLLRGLHDRAAGTLVVRPAVDRRA